jgi:hypothetical protein
MQELVDGKISPIDYGILDVYSSVLPYDFYDKSGGRDIQIGYPQHFTYDSSAPRGALGQALRHADDFIPDFKRYNVQMFYTCGHRHDGRHLYRSSHPLSTGEPNWWVIYTHLLRRCKVILESAVDSTPGNVRTWEAHASGALLIRENAETLSEHPFIDGQHLIYYKTIDEEGHALSHHDPPRMKEEVQRAVEKAFYYGDAAHEEERRAIAQAGYEHAMKYHTSAARVDYMMAVIEQKLNERNLHV